MNGCRHWMSRNLVARRSALGVGAALLLLLGVWANKTLLAPTLPVLESGVLLPVSRQIQAFSLVSDTGPFTPTDLLGHWTLIFAGFTHCPEVCPTTLAQIKTAKAMLGPEPVKRLMVLFLSLDPERDTPERLARYTRHFDPDFRSATGTNAQLDSLAANLGLVFLKQIDPQSGQPVIDHSAQLVLINPDGRLAGYLIPPFSPETLAADLKSILKISP